MRITNILAAVMLTAAVAAPAFAGTDMTRRQIRISDLDLSTAAGQAALKTRVGRAAEALCGSYATTGEQSTIDQITACRAQVTNGINHQVALRGANAQLASAR